MFRRMITIDKERCNGCGACAAACHEGAIEMIDGKAVLIREDYCDGLGDCLPACPTGAITFEEREAPAYDAEAVQRAKATQAAPLPCGCPGTQAKSLRPMPSVPSVVSAPSADVVVSALAQWPCQIKLVPVHAPYLDGANLLIAADCTAYAYANFHARFMKNHITLIGCPKLDSGDYAEKLTQILCENDIKSVKIVRMEVPCCGGIENAVKKALMNSNKFIPWQVITLTTDGRVIE